MEVRPHTDCATLKMLKEDGMHKLGIPGVSSSPEADLETL